MARVGGSLNDLRAKLGNDIAIKAYREGKRPFPDGTIIVRLAYRAVMPEDDNKILSVMLERQGMAAEQVAKLLAESVVAGPLRTFSSWSNTRRNGPRPEVGASPNSRMASPTARRWRRPVFPAMSRPEIATLSLPVTLLKAKGIVHQA